MNDLRNRNVESELQPRCSEKSQGFTERWRGGPPNWSKRAMAAIILAIALVAAVPVYAIASFVSGSLSNTRESGPVLSAQEGPYSLTYYAYSSQKPGDTEVTKDDTGMGTVYGTKSPYVTTYDPNDYSSYSAFFSNPTFHIVGYDFSGTWLEADPSAYGEYASDAEDELITCEGPLELTATWNLVDYNVLLWDGDTNLAELSDFANWNTAISFPSSFTNGELYSGDLESEYGQYPAWASKDGKYVATFDGEDGQVFGSIVNPKNVTDPDELGKCDPVNSAAASSEDEEEDLSVNIDLYPAYAVTVNPNGGVDESQEAIDQFSIYAVKDTDTGTFIAKAPDASGHGASTTDFAGWMLNDDAENLLAENAEFTVTGNSTLTAVWEEPASDSVTYAYSTSNTSYGTVLPANESVTKVTGVGNATVTLSPGYKVIKWQAGSTDIANSAGLTSFKPKASDYTENTSFKAVLGFDVTFNGNGGTLSSDPNLPDQTATVTSLTMPQESAFSTKPEGMTLIGWSDGTNTYQPGTEVKNITKGTTFTAQWADTITYTYQVNNNDYGSVDPTSEAVVKDTGSGSVTATPNTGYKFIKWQTGGSDIAGATSTTFTPSASDYNTNTTFTAVLGFDVVFDKNDGSSTTSTETCTEAKSVNFPTGWTREGYGFAGWSTNKNAKPTDELITDATVSASAPTTYYAVWDKEVTITYAVAPVDDVMGTVAVTGGTGTTEKVDSAHAPKGATAAVSNSSLYEFAGWTKDNPLAAGTPLSTDLSYTPELPTSDCVYYANFKHKTANVTYEPGDHGMFDDVVITTNLGDNTPEYNGPSLAGKPTTPKGYPGYNFTGWSGNRDLATPVTADETYIAQWEAKPGYMINFSYPGLTEAEIRALNLPTAKNTSLTWDSDALTDGVKALSTATLAGYTFGGYYSDSAMKKSVAADAKYGAVAGTDDSSPEKTVYIKITANPVTITFNSNYSPEVTKTQPGNTGKATTLNANPFTRAGYTFGGWATTSDGTKAYDDKASYTPKADDNNLYAIWTANEYTIVFDKNGGTGTMANETRTYGAAAAPLPANEFTREGYKFTGWKAGSTTYEDKQEVNNLTTNKSITLYAQWATSYDIKYDLQGGKADSSVADNYAATKVETNGSYTVKTFDPTKITKAGYTMTGWNTYANGKGTSYIGGETISNINQAYTFYAQWSAKATKYNVKRYVQTDSGYTLLNTQEKTTFNGSAVKTGDRIAAEASDTPTGYTRNDSADVGSGEAIVSEITSAGDEDNPSTLVLYFDRAGYEVEYVYTGATPAQTPPAKATVPFGTTVEVAAAPTANGYKFVPATSGVTANGWAITGLDSIEGTSFTMPAKKVTLTGTWELDTFTVHYLVDSNYGSVSASTEPVQYQKHPEGVTVTPTGTYYLMGWDRVSSDGTETIAENVDPTSYAVESDLYFRAKFGETFAYTYSPGAHPDASFTEVGKDKQPENAEIKTLAQLRPDAVDSEGNPKAAAGYRFAGWKVNGSDATTLPTVLDRDYTFVAQYEALPNSITIVGGDNVTLSDNNYAQSGSNWTKEDVDTASSVTLPNASQISRPGYSLSGWEVEIAGGEKKDYGPTATFDMPAASITAKAKWTADPVTVTYESAAEGSVSPQSETLYAGTASAGATATPKDGYKFKEWVVTGTDTTTDLTKPAIQPSMQSNGSYAAVTYTATYEPATYALTVQSEDKNKGTVAVDGEIKVAYGQTLTAEQIGKITVTPVAPNYTRADVQWTYTRYAADETTVLGKENTPLAKDADLGSITFEGPVTITAKFVGADMTVSFGSTTYPDQTVSYGESVTLPDGKDLSREGYTFAGWDTTNDNTSDTAQYPVVEGQALPTYTPESASTTLYPHWNANTYTITYDANGYDFTPPDSTGFTYGAPNVELSSTVPTIESDPSLEFAGWDTKPTKDGDRYQAGVSYPTEGATLPAENVTLYAVYETKTIKLTYKAGTYGLDNTPATGADVVETLDYGTMEFTALPASTFTADDNYGFQRWLCSNGEYYEADEVKHLTGDGLTEDLTFTAQWKAKEGARIFKLNYMKADGETILKTVNVNLTDTGFAAETPETVANRNFSYWSVSKSTTNAPKVTATDTYETLYTAHGDAVAPASLNLYPHYQLTAYTVKFDGNKDRLDEPSKTQFTGTVDSKTYPYDGSAVGQSLPSGGFTAPGYTFLGWDEDDAADSATYSVDMPNGLKIENELVGPEDEPEITFYAIWEPNDYKVVLKNKKNEDGTTAEDITVGDLKWSDAAIPEAVETPSDLVSQKLKFVGWNTASDGTGTTVKPNETLFGNIAVADYGNTGSTLADAETMNVYACYSDDVAVVTYKDKDGNETKELVEAGEVTLGSNTEQKPGSTAAGWKDESGTVYADGQKVNLSKQAELILEPNFTENTYTITYNNDGGTADSSSVASNTVKWEEGNLLAGVKDPTRPGYNFMGWKAGDVEVTAQTTYAELVADQAAVDADGAELTLVAQWEAVDKTPLKDAIAAAQNSEKDTKVSKDGKDVLASNMWTTAAEKAALDDAIAQAQAIVDKAEATQEEVDNAVNAMKAATNTFNSKKEAGKLVDKSALKSAIDASKSTQDGVETSADGKDIEPANKWTTEAEKANLNNAIAAAQKVYDDPNATQDQVNAATDAVNKAKAAYDAAKKNGLKGNDGGNAGDNDGGDSTDGETQVMYRLYNPNSGEHFYTESADERDTVVAAGWIYEGIGWIAPVKSSTPVFRAYSGTDHHYTTSWEEIENIVAAGWTYEGIGWYSDDAQTVPLYRQFNPNVQPWASFNNSGSHNYTTSSEENDILVSVGWHAEGIGWYAVAKE